MTNKYVIRNCPAYKEYLASIDIDTIKKNISDTNICLNNLGNNPHCQDCTDCVLKQIVEKCKKEIKVYRNTLLPDDGTNTLHFGRQSFAYDILQLLDIQEVE